MVSGGDESRKVCSPESVLKRLGLETTLASCALGPQQTFRRGLAGTRLPHVDHAGRFGRFGRWWNHLRGCAA